MISLTEGIAALDCHKLVPKTTSLMARIVLSVFGLWISLAVFPLAAHADSPGWSAPSAVDPVFFPQSVSCPSASFCAAAGDEGPSNDVGLVKTYNGASWSPPTKIAGVGFLRSISCPSASFCCGDRRAGRRG